MTWPPWPVGVCIPYALHCMPTPCLVKGKKKKKMPDIPQPLPLHQNPCIPPLVKKETKMELGFPSRFFYAPVNAVNILTNGPPRYQVVVKMSPCPNPVRPYAVPCCLSNS